LVVLAKFDGVKTLALFTSKQIIAKGAALKDQRGTIARVLIRSEKSRAKE
jgi:hypothetical protein